MYEAPPKTFAELIEPFGAEIRAVAEWLRALLTEEFPQLEERIYGGAKIANALYSIGGPDRVALGIQPTARSVKLFVHDPEDLPATGFKLEGKGKHMRHIKLTSIPDDRRNELIELVRVPVDRRS